MASTLLVLDADPTKETPCFPTSQSMGRSKFVETEAESAVQATWEAAWEAVRVSPLIIAEVTSTQNAPSLTREYAQHTVLVVPELEWPKRQDPLLTQSVRKLLQSLWAVVVSRALQIGFPLQRTIISTFVDPTEHERKATLSLFCSTNVSQALAFWDSLELDLERWVETLDEPERVIFISKLGLRVHWV